MEGPEETGSKEMFQTGQEAWRTAQLCSALAV